MAGGFQFLTDWLDKLMSGRVSPREAMELPPMWYGVNKITGHCARLPLFIKREGTDGTREKAVKHWAYDRLLLSPNANQSADTFKQQVTGHAVLWGNGRAVVINKGQQDAEILPLMPDRTSSVMLAGRKYHVTKPEKQDRLPLFKSIENDGYEGVLVFPDDEVMHIQGFGFDGVEGMSLVAQMRRALGIPISQEEHAYNQTQKGFAAKLMLEAPPGMFTKEADAKEFIKQFNAAHSSSDNAGKAGLLRNGMKATVLSMSNDDAQFIEQRKFSRQDVALMLGLDGMPGDGDSHSYNSKEMEALNYLDTGLAPWICKWEMQVDLKILSVADRLKGFYSMFDLQELLRTDSKTQAEIHAIHIANRIKNPNQARYDLGLNPYAGGDTYENPSISPGVAGKPDKEDESDEEDRSTKIAEKMLRNMLRREARNAINGANRVDFCSWIDANYAKWEAKMVDCLTDLGLDSTAAKTHCDESREMLLDVAGKSTEKDLKTNVETCVSTWEDRVDAILGAKTC